MRQHNIMCQQKAVLEEVKRRLWDGKGSGGTFLNRDVFICHVIDKIGDEWEIPMQVPNGLKKWIQSLMAGNYSYDGWLEEKHGISQHDFKNRENDNEYYEKTQQARQLWLDWMIQRLTDRIQGEK